MQRASRFSRLRTWSTWAELSIFNWHSSLARSDGTVGGTMQLYDGIGDASEFTNVNGTLFFASDGAGGSTPGRELWRYVP